MAIYSGKKGTNSENQAVRGFTGANKDSFTVNEWVFFIKDTV